MTAPGFQAPALSWDTTYSATQFVPQVPEVLDRVAAGFRTCHQEAAQAVALLGKVDPTHWRSAAADVFRDYVDTLTTYVTTVRDVAGDAVDSVHTARRAVATALATATGDVVRISDVQQRHATYCAEHADDGLVERVLSGTAHDLLFDIQLKQAYDAAAQCTEDALTALDTLATDLDDADHRLSQLSAPEPPSVAWEAILGVIPWDQVPVLQALFGPVDQQLEARGDTAHAQDALDRAQQALAGDDDDRKALLDSLQGLSPQELAYVLNHLDEDDVASLLGSLDPTEDRDTYNRLAATLPPDLLRRLADTDPNHYWHPYPGTGGPWEWNVPDGVATSGDPSLLQQGYLGDCHILSSLAAMETAHPGWLEEHCHRNANGTYTVTLYKDGEPVQVVVTPELPSQHYGDGSPADPIFAHGDPNLYQIYEKAFAQTWDELDPTRNDGVGYDGENGGYPDHDLPFISGTGADRHDSGDVTQEQVRDAMQDGHPVVMSTTGDDDDSPIYDSNAHPDRYLIHGHAYYVTGIDADGNVTVRNPWGSGLPGSGTVTLTWDEFTQMTQGVSVGR